MQNKSLITLCILCLSTSISCSQNAATIENNNTEEPAEKVETKEQEPHRYGGWYCPDNLNGFPAVDIRNWQSVPVVNGRMATKEETQNGTSLIFVDKEKYPDAKPLDIEMPKLARYYNRSSRKEEIIIVIQALNISNDSIVGFRYLNGGNGSARLNEVTFLSTDEVNHIAPSRFVTLHVKIGASKEDIWKVLTDPKYYKTLQSIFDKGNALNAGSDNAQKVNFNYANAGVVTSDFAGDLYGNQYIQIDCEIDDYQYVEKFLVSESEKGENSELIIACGPYGDDFDTQKAVLENWAQKVKTLSESL